ncbi:MAG: AAA family ATPase [Gammaproteobacteria bacterium]|nr:AAA family ATPase [Gammaproteobacteria bacterium]
MTDRIRRLKVGGFRGTTQPLDLVFDDSKPVVLIFGENGTGKSTIVDAIESVGAGTTTFLDNWKLGKGKRKENYIPALGKTFSDVSISLEFGGNTYTAELAASGLQLCSTAKRPITKVLRRKSLQAFMDADPAQRYREVGRFLDIPQIEASEASLREALSGAQRSYDFAVSANNQALVNLQGLWEAEGSPGTEQQHNAETWARTQAAMPIEQLTVRLAKLRDGTRHSEALLVQSESVTAAQQELDQSQQLLEQAEQQLAKVESSESQNNAELVTLLEDAKTYLNKSSDTLCPVCEETTIVPAELAQRLQQRIEGMKELKQASDAKQKAQKNVSTKQDQLLSAKDKLLNVAQDAQRHFSPELSQDKRIEELRESNKEEALNQASQLHGQLATGLTQLREDLEIIQKQVNNLTGIRQYVKTLNEKSTEANKQESLKKRLQQAANIVEAKRKSYVEGVLADIAQEVDNLYQKIHPQEEIGGIKLKLDENQRGSLVYGVAFGGKQDVQPQPYYSESHLDTLGLCIFLALAKRGDSGRTLVILDDVLGSVDQQHLQKAISMTMEEADNFAQLIITTHYRPLRDKFRYARQPANHVQLIELKPWNFMQGIKAGKTLTYVEDLQEQLQQTDFRRESIATQAGILFESLLEFISQTYQCKVPHLIEPRFTFGQLQSAPNTKLKQALKIVKHDNCETPLKPIYDSLTQAIQVRNLVGCHFNEWAGELSNQEVKEMAELALNLADTLVCHHCGSLPSSNKSGSFWECSCKQTQMHPLQQPQ